MSNELREMQEYLRRHDAKRDPSLSDMTDDEGFSQSAPAPAPPVASPREDLPEVISNPKAALEQYQSAAYPPKVIAIDLEAMKVVGSHGRFDLEDNERKQIVAIAIRSMKRAYEKVLETLVKNAGLAPTDEEVAESLRELDGNDAKLTPRKKGSSPG